MTDRRTFIQRSAALLGGLALHQSVDAAFPEVAPEHPRVDPATDEEDFWRQIRAAYACSPTLINLNNGGVSPSPRAAMEALDHYNRMCNEAPSYYMWRILDADREPLRMNLADLAGVPHDELAVCRNATEALNTIIFGLPLVAGDEVVLSTYDYPNMYNAWRQRALRDGVKLVYADPQLPSEDEAAMVEAFTSKFTSKTKLVHITHIVNWNGQILPVKKIADAAHAQGIEVLVDAAHSFGLLDYKIPDLGCDYWGTSLHKFLCAPFGNGLMWMKKEKITKVWPLLSNDKPLGEDIRKFESVGTRSFPIEMATGYSLDLHHLIGSQRKQQRIHFLKNYWMERTKNVPGIFFKTSTNPVYGCAIGVFGIEGKKGSEISEQLFSKWKIHTVAIERDAKPGIEAPFNHVRVTPNVYTTLQELDRLVEAIRVIARA
ncbi:MAG: aminotransferase class V-fold PLP-dependent enzyme [Flavobacteriales bacterium]|nr:aminotransferase class V-fold PLP-dependent enzyme [Flavobacteriales bacterium]